MNMSGQRSIECAVFGFLRNELCVGEFALRSDLRKDLGVDGDDAVDLLERFAQAFDVDVSDFDCSEYFGPEAGLINPFVWLCHVIKPKRDLKPLTVGDLVGAAEKGKL